MNEDNTDLFNFTPSSDEEVKLLDASPLTDKHIDASNEATAFDFQDELLDQVPDFGKPEFKRAATNIPVSTGTSLIEKPAFSTPELSVLSPKLEGGDELLEEMAAPLKMAHKESLVPEYTNIRVNMPLKMPIKFIEL